jgi:hypothetical protein
VTVGGSTAHPQPRPTGTVRHRHYRHGREPPPGSQRVGHRAAQNGAGLDKLATQGGWTRVPPGWVARRWRIPTPPAGRRPGAGPAPCDDRTAPAASAPANAPDNPAEDTRPCHPTSLAVTPDGAGEALKPGPRRRCSPQR